jgi:hypothetical protein
MYIKKNIYSQRGFKCISMPIDANKTATHPITYRGTSAKTDYCFTNIYKQKDNSIALLTEINNKNELFKDIKSDKELNKFDYLIFLLNNYSITSYNDMLEWLVKNKNILCETKIRVIEGTWSIFNESILLIDESIIKVYTEYISSISSNIYTKLFKYIDVVDNKILFDKTLLDYYKYKSERINYLTQKILNYEIVEKFLNKYFDLYKKDRGECEFYFQKKILIEQFISYIEKKILKSIKNNLK